MTAFLGTFSDFKLIKSRSVAVFCIEVPIEDAGKALETLGGLPLPGGERWVGIAPVDPDAASSNGRTPDFDSGDAGSTPAAATTPVNAEPKPRRSIHEVPLPNRAGMVVSDALFPRYLRECRGAFWVDTAAAADKWLKEHLGIESKRDLAGDLDAAGRFMELEALFRSYVQSGEYAREAM